MLDIASLFYNWIDILFTANDSALSSKDLIKKDAIYRDNYSRFVYLFKFIFKINSEKFNFHIYYNKIEEEINSNNRELASILIIQLLDFLIDNQNKIDFNFEFRKKEIRNLKALIVKSDKEKSILICNSSEIGSFKVKLNKSLKEDILLFSKGSLINLIDFDVLVNYETTLIAKNESLIILEPDYKFDVTDIANCFQYEEANYKTYFVNLFEQVTTNENLFLGNLVNYIFDKLLEEDNSEYNTFLEQAFKNRILSGIYVVKSKLWKKIKHKVETHFHNLKSAVSELQYNKVIIEPSFSSVKYGIQGRLDALLLNKDGEQNQFEIIELKSSSSPKIDYIPYPEKNQSKGVWLNNLIQILCYNMLIEGTIKIDKGYLQLLYSIDKDFPFRYIEESIESKKKIIKLRNSLVAVQKSLMLGNYNVLDKLNPNDFGRRPTYYDKKINQFYEVYSTLNELEKTYFNEMFSFILRESFSEKTGAFKNKNRLNNNDNESLNELELDLEKTNLEKMYLVFKLDKDIITSLRIGDQVLVLPENIESGLIHKAYIREFKNNEIIVSLRNKLTIEEFFKRKTKWKLVVENSDSLSKKLFPLLLNVFKSKKKNIILGVEKARDRVNVRFSTNGLTELQNKVVKEAISAKDYFLIQGPPGTGKTSKILFNIIDYYKDKTKNKILITAYTNRAVDQISSVLLENGITDFVRVGSKNNKSKNLLADYADELEFRELIDKLDNCKIFISTVSSLITNPELFELYKFDLGIIDEASQILEVQIAGILSYFKKFIMIGDEKQLPAVCSQDYEFRKVDSKLLKDIYLNDLGESLFSRLLKICKVNKYDNYILLEEQGRMNKEIMALANSMFYENHLKLLFDKNITNEIFDNPIIFIDNNVSHTTKMDDNEAKLISNLTRYLVNNGISEKEIGIISPFRLQCHNIKTQLDEEYKDKIVVDTVERFQGSEKEFIIISFATNKEYLLKQISSLYEFDGLIVDRKLNVAITRAKQQLILVGNSRILSLSNIFNDLLNYIKKNNKVYDIKEFSELLYIS